MKHPHFAAIVVALSVFAPENPCLASEIIVGQQVPAVQQVSIDQISHDQWDALLRTYCDPQGLVNYKAWKESRQERQKLEQYLQHLAHADPTRPASQEAKLAFWINAYNAVTIEGILREYPTTSIRNHTAKLFGYNIWDDLLLPVGDRTYSLNQIEHDVLRKMGDPRIHFAIVCASIGCPPLLDHAYTAEKLDDQLTANAKRFFADATKFRYDASKQKIEISPILDWFAEDFGANQAAQLRTIAPYLPDQPSQALAQNSRASVRYLDYDWSLNDQATQD